MSDPNSPAEVDRKDHFFREVEGSFAVFGSDAISFAEEDRIRLDKITAFGPDPLGNSRCSVWADVGGKSVRLGYVREHKLMELRNAIEKFLKPSATQVD